MNYINHDKPGGPSTDSGNGHYIIDVPRRRGEVGASGNEAHHALGAPELGLRWGRWHVIGPMDPHISPWIPMVPPKITKDPRRTALWYSFYVYLCLCFFCGTIGETNGKLILGWLSYNYTEITRRFVSNFCKQSAVMSPTKVFGKPPPKPWPSARRRRRHTWNRTAPEMKFPEDHGKIMARSRFWFWDFGLSNSWWWSRGVPRNRLSQLVIPTLPFIG